MRRLLIQFPERQRYFGRNRRSLQMPSPEPIDLNESENDEIYDIPLINRLPQVEVIEVDEEPQPALEFHPLAIQDLQAAPEFQPQPDQDLQAQPGPHPEPEAEQGPEPLPADQIVEEDALPTNENPQSPSPPKKRKRSSLGQTPKLKKSSDDDDIDDDGLTCPICLDSWEMSGEHRLVALKCGHLFGDSCIRRWLVESGRNGAKSCPQCKTRAVNKDIRGLYARRVRALDRSEEHELREHLDQEKAKTTSIQTELATLKMSYTMLMQEVKKLTADNERLKNTLRQGRGSMDADSNIDSVDLARLRFYKLFLEKNIEIAKEPGCRVMIYSQNFLNMMVSQKCPQNLFPGYGLRFIDTPTFRPTIFLHTSTKTVRDICLSSDQTLLAAASMEPRAKLFDTRSRTVVSSFSPTDKPLWACSLDRSNRENTLYVGAQHGSTYSYDIRFPETVVEEFKTEGDLSPVINIAPVSVTKHFPNGGFLVCKLQSLWFYEYTEAAQEVIATKISIEGPFISMSYDVVSENLLVFARSSTRYPSSRYILGKLEKMDDLPVFNVRVSFFGSKATPVMTRCSQIAVENNTLVAGYIQDSKLLTLFDMKREQRLQSMPVQEVVYDTCAVYVPNSIYLAALTETKCRIYKVTSTDR